MKKEVIPEGFNVAFIQWFKKKTEDAWHEGVKKDFILKKMVRMQPWERKLRWVGNVSENCIKKIEKKWKLKFPADYRLFLKELFILNEPRHAIVYNKHNKAAIKKIPMFNNWLKDTKTIRHFQSQLFDGLWFDIRNNGLWLKGWGSKPQKAENQRRRLKKLLKKAPRLIPIYQHRYLLIEPNKVNNPVFSIWQSDIIVYGPTLKTYLLSEFKNILNVDDQKVWFSEFKKQRKFIESIPFWGELYRRNIEQRS
ncbi:MAG: hypothetical protein Q8O30_10570 [Candidatus Omnitrophota bacterium]|nr:hypothetical protein [Candidatus Omnitrophota bacterium]